MGIVLVLLALQYNSLDILHVDWVFSSPTGSRPQDLDIQSGTTKPCESLGATEFSFSLSLVSPCSAKPQITDMTALKARFAGAPGPQNLGWVAWPVSYL